MKIEFPGDLFYVDFKAWHKPSRRLETFTFEDITKEDSETYINGNKIEEYENLTIELD